MSRILARLGEPAAYSAAGGNPVSVQVMFYSPYQVQLGIAAGSSPMVAVMATDVPSLADGDTFTLRATTYKVREPKPDPVSGITVCTLED